MQQRLAPGVCCTTHSITYLPSPNKPTPGGEPSASTVNNTGLHLAKDDCREMDGCSWSHVGLMADDKIIPWMVLQLNDICRRNVGLVLNGLTKNDNR